MKTYSISVIMVIVLILFALLFLVYMRFPKLVTPPKTFSIALLAAILDDNVDELVINALKQTLRDLAGEKYSFTFKTYNNNLDRNLLRSQIEEICDERENPYDLIFSIGGSEAQMIHAITTKKGFKTPVVFTAQKNPVEIGIVNSLESSGNHLTGVTEIASPDYLEKMADFLNVVKPESKNILILCNPTENAGYTETESQELAHHLKKRHKDVTILHVYHFNEIQEKVSGLLQNNVDTLVTFNDGTTMQATDTLVRLCNKNKVTFYSLNSQAVEKGAALGYGIQFEDYGIEAAKLVYKILCQGIEPTNVPITRIAISRKFLINKKTMKKQGLDLKPDALSLLRDTKLVNVLK